MKEIMGMNPLLVSVGDNLPMTETDKHNMKNISEAFGYDLIIMQPNIRAQKTIMKLTFEKYGKPTYFIDKQIYTYPLHMAIKFNTPLLAYSENVGYEYGRSDAVEAYSSRDQIYNGVGAGVLTEELLVDGVTLKDLAFFEPPAKEQIDSLDTIYLSYFLERSSFKNHEIAKKW